MDEFEIEIKMEFLEEAKDLLQDAEAYFLELENGASEEGLVIIFRLAHNLKGSSGAVGFPDITEITHTAENLILKIQKNEIEVTTVVVEALLEFKDRVDHMVDSLFSNLELRFDSSETIKKLDDLVNGTNLENLFDEIEVVQESLQVDTNNDSPSISDMFSDELESKAVEASAEETVSDAAIASLVESGGYSKETLLEMFGDRVNQFFEESDTSRLVSDEAILSLVESKQFTDEQLFEKFGKDRIQSLVAIESKSAVAPEVIIEDKEVVNNVTPIETSKIAKEKTSKKAPTKSETIRVNLEKISELNNLVGELVINQSVLTRLNNDSFSRELSTSISQLKKISSEIQDIAMSLRMVPVKGIFIQMQRIIRDVSRELDKEVELELVGETTEIDKTILEKLKDPLVHIIRNAVDHGVEDGEDRVALGKKSQGHVSLSARHEGSKLIIEIKDDGKGINSSIIREKAIAKGIIQAQAQLTEEQIYQLIFHPGFSTKEVVSEISGRGVGMDVVKNNIFELGGDVRVETELGNGSKFVITLPLTTAIISGVVTQVSHSNFIFPLQSIREFVSTKGISVKYLSGIGDCINLRGEIVPVYSMRKEFDIQEEFSGASTLVVIESSDHIFAVSVDSILSQQQIVVKPVDEILQQNEAIMGSTVLGDGAPAFIIDLISLFGKDIVSSKNQLKETELLVS